jgi:hypothetical protein
VWRVGRVIRAGGLCASLAPGTRRGSDADPPEDDALPWAVGSGERARSRTGRSALLCGFGWAVEPGIGSSAEDEGIGGAAGSGAGVSPEAGRSAGAVRC